MTRDDFLERVFDFENNETWLYQGQRPCLIEFTDPACGPCRLMAPIITDLAGQYRGRVEFYEVDINDEKELARELGIEILPTIALCPIGKPPVVLLGAILKPKLAGKIEEELLGEKKSPHGSEKTSVL